MARDVCATSADESWSTRKTMHQQCLPADGSKSWLEVSGREPAKAGEGAPIKGSKSNNTDTRQYHNEARWNGNAT